MEDIQKSDADDVVSSFGVVALILGIASALFGLVQVIDQPYTESELSNFVDTWQPEVWGGLILLALFALGAFGSMVFALLCRSMPRRFFGAATLAFLVAVVLEIAWLNLLTARTEQASGQPLSWWPVG